MNIQQRRIAAEELLKQKIANEQQVTEERNKLITEMVELRGQLTLLNELEHEEQKNKLPDEKKDTVIINNLSEEK